MMMMKKMVSNCNVSFFNLDLANLVNGWPGDPVELRPFDCHFTPERIIKTWIAVGFLPMMMMGNVANDPKVRHKLGDGGAPLEAAIWLEALHKEYCRVARVLTGMGFNGNMMDVKLPKVKKSVVFKDNEEKIQIQYFVDNRLINKAGGLYKMGTIVANCSVVLGVGGGRCIAELEKQAKEVVALKKADQSVDVFNNAKKAHAEWVRKGQLVDEDGSPKLD